MCLQFTIYFIIAIHFPIALAHFILITLGRDHTIVPQTWRKLTLSKEKQRGNKNPNPAGVSHSFTSRLPSSARTNTPLWTLSHKKLHLFKRHWAWHFHTPYNSMWETLCSNNRLTNEPWVSWGREPLRWIRAAKSSRPEFIRSHDFRTPHFAHYRVEISWNLCLFFPQLFLFQARTSWEGKGYY